MNPEQDEATRMLTSWFRELAEARTQDVQRLRLDAAAYRLRGPAAQDRLAIARALDDDAAAFGVAAEAIEILARAAVAGYTRPARQPYRPIPALLKTRAAA